MEQCTEADAIGWEFDGDDDLDYLDMTPQEFAEFNIKQKRDQLIIAYNTAKSAKVKSKVACPMCGKKHIKTTYHKIFDKAKCRERYWNFVDETRYKRTLAQ